MQLPRITWLFLSLAANAAMVPATPPDDGQWILADRQTMRLSPRVFRSLPTGIVKYLVRRGCSIPQSPEAGTTAPHNVIRGEFQRPGQRDWAVLCSTKSESSILVFGGARTQSVTETAKAKDIDFLQRMDEGKIVYSRVIGTVDRQYIWKHFQWYGGSQPPPIDHHGINDAFAGKGSVVLYWYRGRWLKLQGAD